MPLRFIRISSFALSLLSIATFSFANSEKVPCPVVTAVQQAAQTMDEALKQDDGSYTVFKSYHQSSFWDEYAGWHVSVSKISANSSYDAIVIGKYVLQQTSFKKNENANANANDSLYGCYYGPGDIAAIGFPLK